MMNQQFTRSVSEKRAPARLPNRAVDKTGPMLGAAEPPMTPTTNHTVAFQTRSRKPWISNGYAVLFLVGVAASVFSISVPVMGRYIEVPAEILAVAGLLALPFMWSRSLPMSFLLASILVSSAVFGTMLSGLSCVAMASFGFFLLPALYEKCGWSESLFADGYRTVGILLGLWILVNPFSPGIDVSYKTWNANPFVETHCWIGIVLSSVICINLCHVMKGKRPIINIAMVVFFLVLIMGAGSRAGLFSIAPAIGLLAYRQGTRTFLPLAFLTAAILGMSALVINVKPEISENVYHRYIATDTFQNTSFQGRVMSWHNYLDASLSYPFGLGYERSIIEFLEGRESHRDFVVPGAHSEFLKILVELGWLPFLVFVFINVEALTFCLKPRVGSEGEAGTLNLTLSMIYIVLLPQLLVNDGMSKPEVNVLYWFALGALLRLNQRRPCLQRYRSSNVLLSTRKTSPYCPEVVAGPTADTRRLQNSKADTDDHVMA